MKLNKKTLWKIQLGFGIILLIFTLSFSVYVRQKMFSEKAMQNIIENQEENWKNIVSDELRQEDPTAATVLGRLTLPLFVSNIDLFGAVMSLGKLIVIFQTVICFSLSLMFILQGLSGLKA